MLTNLSRETLPEQIAQSLIEFIRTQDLRPGDLLPSEAKLAGDFRVSRSVVREALKSLAAQGVVEVVSGKGAIVRPVDDKLLRLFFQRVIQFERATLIDLMDVRKPIEVQSASMAAQRRTAEELAYIAETVVSMREHLNDLETYIDLDVEFHLLIASATHNTIMYHLINSIRDPLKDVIREGLRRRDTTEQLERVQRLHEAILAAIEHGDASEAGQAMAQHFDEAVTALVK